MTRPIAAAVLLLACSALTTGCDRAREALGGSVEVTNTAYPERVYWGDTHLHTGNSFDAFAFGNRLSPEDALRFARGEEVESSTKIKARLERPLDFLVISDHADGLGSTKALYDAPRVLLTDPRVRRWHDMLHQGPQESTKAIAEMIAARTSKEGLPAIMNDPEAARERVADIWQENIETVERYNDPGKFTAFIGFEYTLMPGGNNLHRNVIFRDGADKAGTVGVLDATGETSPDKLFDYMESYERTTGGKVLSIPHNSNMSNGMMFELTQPGGGPMSADYARRRAAREPVVEITQIKGDSEAHPFLSPNDEYAGYGIAGWDANNIASSQATKPEDQFGNYVREALKRGLAIEQRTGANPYRFGVIGSTDSHTALATGDENNFFGKHPAVEPSAARMTAGFVPNLNTGRFNWQTLASGYAAVWATSNTREAIFDAMMRREVYATTGPRMTVRVFGGWDFKAEDLERDWVKAGYARGVPMGGVLKAGSGTPSFIISAMKDSAGANLDRIQVVKGWIDAAGNSQEKVFDVVWSDMDNRKTAGGKVPAVGDTVDVARATYQNTIGAPNLATVWSDPEFNPAQRAFYYVRVLEIPTPTWQAYDAVRYRLQLNPEVPVKQQERAYTSAIWYAPA